MSRDPSTAISTVWAALARDPSSWEVPPVPWLEKPPRQVDVRIGRQLFVDDYLIESTTFRRRFHQPERFSGNPVLRPQSEVELNGGVCPVAVPFSDGVFYDPQDQLFKMWYHAGWFDGTALAISDDGISWRRPNLGIVGTTNLVMPHRQDFRRDGVSVWLDHDTREPHERFKMFLYARSETHGTGGRLLTSANGVKWTERHNSGLAGDNTTFFYDPFRRLWIFSIRRKRRPNAGRTRDLWGHEDFLQAGRWTGENTIPWAATDKLDQPDPSIGDPTQLYKIDAVAYESLMLGVFTIHKGPSNEICEKGGHPKVTDLMLAYSRDGFHWHRPSRENFLEATRIAGNWERAYLHSVGGVCLVVRDKLYFYYGGWSGDSPKRGGDIYAGGSTGLAVLRRDGFASLDTDEEGDLVTRRLLCSGGWLFVNAQIERGGWLRGEVLAEDGRPLDSFQAADCFSVTGDSVIHRVLWKRDNAIPAGPIQLRIRMKKAKLYSFWITPDEAGASNGYVAGGGPGFSGARDTVGKRVLGDAKQLY